MRARRKNSSASSIAILGLVLMVGAFVAPQFSRAAFTEPATTPLKGTPPTFLNGSSATQTKLGSLLIGPAGGSVLFCLNSDTSKSIRDPANIAPPAPGVPTCIDAWSDLATAGGIFVRRQQNTTPSDPLDPRTYGTADRGFATVIGNAANNQGLSLVAKVNTASSASVRYALYATDGGSNTRSAAQLSGRSVIFKPGSTSEELCLNGQCITQWSGAFLFGNAGIIRLQNTITLTSDIGNSSVSGSTQFTRGLTIGRPTDNTPVSSTNGDGQCTEENDEPVGGAVDC